MAVMKKKLSVKEVCGKIDAADLPRDGDPVLVARFYGIARSFKTGATQQGDWIRFLGPCHGINVKTGEEFDSSGIHLPGAAEEMLAGMVSKDGSREVQYAFDVFVKYDDATPMRYVYECRSLIEGETSDQLATVAQGLPSLPSRE